MKRTLHLWLVLTLPLPALAEVSCHIHPPGSTPDNPVNIVGPYDSVAACEQARLEQFGPMARCHCSADFSPAWRLPPQPEPAPGAPPTPMI